MSHAASSPPGTVLISQLLLEDADLRDIVEEFVGSLAQRVSELQNAYQTLDWEALTTFAHRLKGAGGSYGYPEISQLAARMEQCFRGADASNFDQQITALANLAAAARAGLATP